MTGLPVTGGVPSSKSQIQVYRSAFSGTEKVIARPNTGMTGVQLIGKEEDGLLVSA